jgi:hypothetical protein
MNCECPVAGYCSRHKVDKTNHLWHLCRTKPEYFQAWEENRGPGQRNEGDRKKRYRVVQSREELAVKGRKLWDDLFEKVHSFDDLCEWSRGIPSYGCDCKSFYESFLRSNHPGNFVNFEWKHSLKSAVNAKLGKDNLDLVEALTVYDQKFCDNPKRDDIVSVTAISVKKHKIEHQQKCIASWERFGLQVYAKNTPEEIEQLRDHFPSVTFIESRDLGTVFDYPTQTIRGLARTSVELDKPVLVINSDIELRGCNEWLTFDEASQFIGVRWNYDAEFPRIVTEFRYGLDAFSFTPKQSLLLPDDFPFAIGHPIWDYAVPALMRHYGIGLNIVHRPMLFHCNHNQNWHIDDWFFGQQWVKNHIGLHIEYSTADFRDSLEKPGWKYNHTRWIKHV